MKRRILEDEKVCFVEFCRLACPKYANRVAENTLKKLAGDIGDLYDIDFYKLLSQAKKFFSENPNGVSIEADFPKEIKGKILNDTNYKQLISDSVKHVTGVYIPPTSLLPGPFYDALIKGCIISLNRNPLFRGLDKIVEIPFVGVE